MADSEPTPVDREINRADYTAFLGESADRLKFQVEFSQSALRNLHLVNGGGILALLTLVGNSNVQYDARVIWWAFFWFSSGLIASLIAYFGAYFSQSFFMNIAVQQAWNAQAISHGLNPPHDWSRDWLIGNRALWGGIAAATSSLLAFVVGSFVALGGIL